MAKYPILSFASSVMKVIGVFALFIAAYLAIYQGIIEPLQPRHGFGLEDVVEIGEGLIVAMTGLGALAFGELVAILVNTEYYLASIDNKLEKWARQNTVSK